MEPALTTVVIVTYQSSVTVRDALNSLREPCSNRQLRCIVVDNASSDGTLELLRQETDWLELIEFPVNVGYGRACNRAWGESRTPYVLFLNPDARLEMSALSMLVDFMEEHPKAGIVAPALIDAEGNSHLVGGLPTPWGVVGASLRLRRPHRQCIAPGSAPFETDWLCGAVQLVRGELWRHLGGFDPRFFLYFEETDLCVRARQAGYELWAVGEAVGFHARGRSAVGSGLPLSGSMISTHFYRSRMYYLAKHHGWPQAIAAELADVLGCGARALARKVLGRDASDLVARLRAPILRTPARVGSLRELEPSQSN